MRTFVLVLKVLLFLYSVNSLAAKTIQIKGMEIKGNAEQPKVLYIVPWQATADAKEIDYAPFGNIEDAAKLLEPETFQKQLYFKRNLRVNVEPMPKN